MKTGTSIILLLYLSIGILHGQQTDADKVAWQINAGLPFQAHKNMPSFITEKNIHDMKNKQRIIRIW